MTISEEGRRRLSESNKGPNGNLYGVYGEDHPKSKLSLEEALTIYNRLQVEDVKRIDIAEEYGISKDTVSKIKHGRHWSSRFLKSK